MGYYLIRAARTDGMLLPVQRGKITAKTLALLLKKLPKPFDDGHALGKFAFANFCFC